VLQLIHQRLNLGVGLCRSNTEALLSLLWAWKGSFENVLGELDRVLTALWAGLVQFGLGCGPIERKMGPWAIKRAQSFRKAKAKAVFFSKGPCKPRPIYESRPAPVSETPVIPRQLVWSRGCRRH
jgi:hypothetical protein